MKRSFPTNIRSSALEKLATLAVKTPAASDNGSDIARLTRQYQEQSKYRANSLSNGILKHQASTSQVPMVCIVDPSLNGLL